MELAEEVEQFVVLAEQLAHLAPRAWSAARLENLRSPSLKPEFQIATVTAPVCVEPRRVGEVSRDLMIQSARSAWPNEASVDYIQRQQPNKWQKAWLVQIVSRCEKRCRICNKRRCGVMNHPFRNLTSPRSNVDILTDFAVITEQRILQCRSGQILTLNPRIRFLVDSSDLSLVFKRNEGATLFVRNIYLLFARKLAEYITISLQQAEID